MPNFRVNHEGVQGLTVESIVIDVPTAGVACVYAAEWSYASGNGILAGDLHLTGIREISDREAWSILDDERQV